MTRVKSFGLPLELSLLETQIPFGNNNKRGLFEELVVGPKGSGWHEGQQILRVAQDDKGEGFGLPLELSLLVTQIPFGNDNKRGLVEELVVARRVRGGVKESRSFALLRMTRVKGFGLSGDCSCALEKQIPFEDDRKKSNGNCKSKCNGNCKSKCNGRSKGKCSAGAMSLVLPVVPRTYQDHGSCR